MKVVEVFIFTFSATMIYILIRLTRFRWLLLLILCNEPAYRKRQNYVYVNGEYQSIM